MSIQMYGRYGSTPRRRVPPEGGATRGHAGVSRGAPAWPSKERRAYAHNGTAEGLALSLSLVPLWQFQGAQTHPETPALTDEVLRTDVLAGRTVYRTGDLVYRTDEGDYVYVDRADRVIKRMGVRISLVELAEALRRLEGVTAAVCVAYDEGGQLAIAAFVTGEGLGSPLDI